MADIEDILRLAIPSALTQLSVLEQAYIGNYTTRHNISGGCYIDLDNGGGYVRLDYIACRKENNLESWIADTIHNHCENHCWSIQATYQAADGRYKCNGFVSVRIYGMKLEIDRDASILQPTSNDFFTWQLRNGKKVKMFVRPGVSPSSQIWSLNITRKVLEDRQQP